MGANDFLPPSPAATINLHEDGQGSVPGMQGGVQDAATGALWPPVMADDEPTTVRGWVIADSITTDIALEVAGFGIQVVQANLPAPPDSGLPNGARCFAWRVPPRLIDGQSREVRAWDLTIARELAGSPMLIPADANAPQSEAHAFGLRSGMLAGEASTAAPVPLGDGAFASARQPALRLRYAMVTEAPGADGTPPRRGVRLLADAVSPGISLHFTPGAALPPAEIALPVRIRAWLPQATDSLTQADAEIWLSRREDARFLPVRRLRRGRIFRQSTWLSADLQLTEAEAAMADSLCITITALNARGVCALPPEIGDPPVPPEARMEDARLEESFGALAGLVRTHRTATDSAPTLPAAPVDAVHPPTQIVVPVHNGGLIVRDGLRALQAAMTGPCEVLVIDDGSRAHTAALLRAEVAGDRRFALLRRDANRGYTKSINEGVMATTAPFVVVLNSDTLVSLGWLDRLHAALRARPGTGMAGPLSNAATWQSIPEARRQDGSWSSNDRIAPRHRDRVQALVSATSERAYPSFPILNGFCTLIARTVFDAIGLYDEDAFPMGYGEETDLCLRARRAGFGLSVADDCFVYHHKSISFGSATRSRLTRAGRFEMLNKHLGVNIPALEQDMQSCPPMVRARARLADLLAELDQQ